MARKKKETILHVERSTHKATVHTRVSAGQKVANTAPKSPIYSASAAMKQAATDVGSATTDLSGAQTEVTNAEAVLAAAKAKLGRRVLTFDTSYDVFASHVEAAATTAEEAAALGASLATRTLHPLVPPSRVEVTLDHKKNVVRVVILGAPGLPRVALEMTSDPTNTASWKRLDGYGLRRSIANLPPGTYAFRAASQRKDQRSEFTLPVSIVVK